MALVSIKLRNYLFFSLFLKNILDKFSKKCGALRLLINKVIPAAAGKLY